MSPILLSLILPLLGAGVIAVVGDRPKGTARMIALAVSLAAAGLAAYVVAQSAWAGQSIEFDRAWLDPAWSGVNVRFHVGLDGLGLWLYGLAALLSVTGILVSWQAVEDRPAGFYALLMLLETGMLGVFAARDVILFYVFFEFTLIPLFFLVGVWGSEQRQYAAVKFFLYTLAGSVLTFLGLLAIVFWVRGPDGALTFSITELVQLSAQEPMPPAMQWVVFLALFAGFAVKVPIFPFHTWLPLAHVQAPTAGSVLLAGILLKIGAYGFVRFSLPLLPEASVRAMPWIIGLSVAGILVGALLALAQKDIKRLIAYSSVSHLGFCTLGMFSLTAAGLSGSVLQMINHGISTGALFALVGMLYERYHTREIAALGGLARKLPIMASAFVLFTMSSIGLPLLNGFVGEFLILAGAFQRGWGESSLAPRIDLQVASVLAVLGVVLGAWYMLWLVQRIFFGPLKEPPHDASSAEVRDLSLREIAALAPLALFVFWIGLAPDNFVRSIEEATAAITARTDRLIDPRPPSMTAGRPATASLGLSASIEE